MARDAIDVGGHGVLMVDAHQRMAWRSPRTQRWLGEFFAHGSDDDAYIAWLNSSADAAVDVRTRTLGDRTLTARRLGSVGLGEVMWLLSL
ncbi:hypothetical protein ABTM54_19155, partial [Acinetobacter baumannii]